MQGAGGVALVTSAGLYRQAGEGWAHVARPQAQKTEDARAGLQLVYDLHDGRFWGKWGVPITDAVSAALIVLVLTGYALFIGRELKIRLARRRRQAAERMAEPVGAPR